MEPIVLRCVTAPVKSHRIILAAAVFAVLSGCKDKQPCEPGEYPDSFSAIKADLPAEMFACIDDADDANRVMTNVTVDSSHAAFILITQHLEGKGWTRTHQQVQDNFATGDYVKDDTKLRVGISQLDHNPPLLNLLYDPIVQANVRLEE